jgi:carboxymethylenebutenolidase
LGYIERWGFLVGAFWFAVGSLTAALLLGGLRPTFAAPRVAPDDARLSAERVEYPSPKGTGKMRGYLVKPAKPAGRLPGVLVIHENRGLNPHIEDVARRFALEGYLAFAPDALASVGGYPGDEDQARAKFKELDPEKAREDFRAALAWLRERPEGTGKVGAVGFCWGGGMVNWLATQTADLAAGVPFYGSGPETADVARIRTPLLIQSAEVDERINAGWPDFEAALKAAGATYERHLYPGTQHGFHNDTTPRYDAEAAALAWKRTLEFLGRHVRA